MASRSGSAIHQPVTSGGALVSRAAKCGSWAGELNGASNSSMGSSITNAPRQAAYILTDEPGARTQDRGGDSERSKPPSSLSQPPGQILTPAHAHTKLGSLSSGEKAHRTKNLALAPACLGHLVPLANAAFLGSISPSEKGYISFSHLPRLTWRDSEQMDLPPLRLVGEER